MEVKTKEADSLILANTSSSFINFSVCVEPTAKMEREDKIACILTRVAYLFGSMDNITAIVLVADLK